MINYQPVSGIEMDIMPSHTIIIDSVILKSNRLSKNHDFSVYNNSGGKILSFSMEGQQIPKSKNSTILDNIIFSVSYKYGNIVPDSIWIVPILADSKGNVIECNSLPFQIGK